MTGRSDNSGCVWVLVSEKGIKKMEEFKMEVLLILYVGGGGADGGDRERGSVVSQSVMGSVVLWCVPLAADVRVGNTK